MPGKQQDGTTSNTVLLPGLRLESCIQSVYFLQRMHLNHQVDSILGIALLLIITKPCGPKEKLMPSLMLIEMPYLTKATSDSKSYIRQETRSMQDATQVDKILSLTLLRVRDIVVHQIVAVLVVASIMLKETDI